MHFNSVSLSGRKMENKEKINKPHSILFSPLRDLKCKFSQDSLGHLYRQLKRRKFQCTST